jgi:hypothetical protein
MPPPLTQTMYLRYNTKQECKQASADLWVRLLGHPKNPADMTEFIFDSLGCQDGAHDYLILSEPLFSQIYPKLTAQEKNFIDANMVPASNVQVQNCLASVGRT